MTRLDRSFFAHAPILAILSAACLAQPAAADWLVTRDGVRVETAGEWQVKGKLVVFQAPNGDLSSMRLDEVDLDASRQATEDAKRPPQVTTPTPVEKPRAVLVLTDADVTRVRPSDKEEVKAEETLEPGDLEVTDFDEVEDPNVDGLAFSGTVRNNSDKMMLSPRVTMSLYDVEGGLIASVEAPASAGFLRPSQSAPFRINFPTVFGYATTDFETAGDGLSIRPPGEEEPDEYDAPLNEED